jgi:hypothetical protein
MLGMVSHWAMKSFKFAMFPELQYVIIVIFVVATLGVMGCADWPFVIGKRGSALRKANEASTLSHSALQSTALASSPQEEEEGGLSRNHSRQPSMEQQRDSRPPSTLGNYNSV